MTTFAFIAVIASALFHSSYNLMIKSGDEKTLFMWSIFSVAVTAGWVTAWVTDYVFPEAALPAFLVAVVSAAFFTLYHLCAARAYASHEGDLSLSYPITTLAPIFIPIWAFVFLGNTFTIAKVAGILISTAGTFCIQLKPSSAHGGFRSIGFRSEAVRYALEITDVSYAAGVRQSASLFAVLMGVFLLREPYGLHRLFASLLIAMGIALIKIG